MELALSANVTVTRSKSEERDRRRRTCFLFQKMAAESHENAVFHPGSGGNGCDLQSGGFGRTCFPCAC